MGLWTRKPDTRDTPDRRKAIYEVFQKADTSEWQQTFEFALPMIGIKSWNDVTPGR